MCGTCYSHCGIRAHVVDGVVVKIEGNPAVPNGRGRICAKGLAQVQTLYDPYRLTVPLLRMNPEKGLETDPKWKKISWEEALEIYAQKLKEAEPETIYGAHSTHRSNEVQSFLDPLWNGLGVKEILRGGAMFCASNIHLIEGLNMGTWEPRPDYAFCNYLIYFGSQHGAAAGHAFATSVRHRSEAYRKGMHVVCVDPVYNESAEKADEWIPIKVGTDSAFILAICNLLVNEYKMYDAEYLKEQTNGVYLIGPDGLYVRDKMNGKPLVWDAADQMPKTYDDAGIKDYSLFGSYNVDGTQCKPAFQMIKDHLTKYTAKYASQITDIPEETIRRIAKEFGLNAQIGSNIVLDGHKLRYRPVSAYYLQGLQGHKHGMLAVMAADLLVQLVGARGAVGGCVGTSQRWLGWPGTGKPNWTPKAGADGLLATGLWMHGTSPYPLKSPSTKQGSEFNLSDMTLFGGLGLLAQIAVAYNLYDKYKIRARPKLYLNFGVNNLISGGNIELFDKFLKAFPYHIRFALWLDEEANGYADLVLPDASQLEKYSNFPLRWVLAASGTAGLAEPEWCWFIQQPVVNPIGQCRSHYDVTLEVLQRTGKLAQVLDCINEMWMLKEPYKLDNRKTYPFTEILDRQLKNFFGAEHGLGWFKENGVLTWQKRIEEVYWTQFVKPVPRASIYWEILLKFGLEGAAATEREGIEWDWSDFQAFPDYKECPRISSAEFDMIAFFHRHPYEAGGSTWTDELPWIHELSKKSWSDRKIMMNRDTAKDKGIGDGDEVWVESGGGKIKGNAVLTHGIRKDVIELGQGFGAWSNGTPIRSESPTPGVACIALAEAATPEHWLEYHQTSTMTPCAHTWVKVYKAK